MTEKCPKCGTFLTTIESPFENEENILIRYCKKCKYERTIHKKDNKINNKKNNIIIFFAPIHSSKPINNKYETKWDEFKSLLEPHNFLVENDFEQELKKCKTPDERISLMFSRKIMHDIVIMIEQMYNSKLYNKLDKDTAVELMDIHEKLYKIFEKFKR